MIKVLFICHGNICRSTMSQFVLQDMVNRHDLQNDFYINSAATSREEIGNGPHYGTIRKLQRESIRYKEVVELADALGYELIWQKRREK